MIRSMSMFYDGIRACMSLGSRVGDYFEVKEGVETEECNFPVAL